MKRTPSTQATTNCTIVNQSPENSGFPNHPPENSGYRDQRRYECKTCQKRFDTFQALGGHQGIHRKLIHSEDILLSLQIAAAPKLHQCKACMMKFPTGQALGGHMRRHRLKKTPISMNTELLWRQQAAEEEVVESDLTSPAAVEPQWLKAEEDQWHKLKSELVLAAKELQLSI